VIDAVASPNAGMTFLQPFMWRPFPELLNNILRLLVTKWFLPGDVKVARDGGPATVERTDFIAFHVFGLGSFMQLFKIML
jgi:hypothetical protein